jgi:hypothetical protein
LYDAFVCGYTGVRIVISGATRWVASQSGSCNGCVVTGRRKNTGRDQSRNANVRKKAATVSWVVAIADAPRAATLAETGDAGQRSSPMGGGADDVDGEDDENEDDGGDDGGDEGGVDDNVGGGGGDDQRSSPTGGGGDDAKVSDRRRHTYATKTIHAKPPR